MRSTGEEQQQHEAGDQDGAGAPCWLQRAAEPPREKRHAKIKGPEGRVQGDGGSETLRREVRRGPRGLGSDAEKCRHEVHAGLRFR